jgi:hypothetical protein
MVCRLRMRGDANNDSDSHSQVMKAVASIRGRWMAANLFAEQYTGKGRGDGGAPFPSHVIVREEHTVGFIAWAAGVGGAVSAPSARSWPSRRCRIHFREAPSSLAVRMLRPPSQSHRDSA